VLLLGCLDLHIDFARLAGYVTAHEYERQYADGNDQPTDDEIQTPTGTPIRVFGHVLLLVPWLKERATGSVHWTTRGVHRRGRHASPRITNTGKRFGFHTGSQMPKTDHAIACLTNTLASP
jgi:hypothetical protein